MSATAGSGGMSDPSTRDPTLPSRRSVRTRRHRHAAACETVWVHLLRLPLRTIARWPLVAGALVVLSAGCSEQGRTVGAYCDAVATRLELVVSPPLAWDGDIGAVLEAYRAITATAPAAIEPEWAALVSSLETVSTVEAMEWARRLAREEGLLVGVSTGANVAVARRLAIRPENAGKTIVTFACSTGERYLSTPLYQLIGMPGGAAAEDFGL